MPSEYFRRAGKAFYIALSAAHEFVEKMVWESKRQKFPL
jgi:hypothetical protein